MVGMVGASYAVLGLIGLLLLAVLLYRQAAMVELDGQRASLANLRSDLVALQHEVIGREFHDEQLSPLRPRLKRHDLLQRAQQRFDRMLEDYQGHALPSGPERQATVARFGAISSILGRIRAEPEVDRSVAGRPPLPVETEHARRLGSLFLETVRHEDLREAERSAALLQVQVALADRAIAALANRPALSLEAIASAVERLERLDKSVGASLRSAFDTVRSSAGSDPRLGTAAGYDLAMMVASHWSIRIDELLAAQIERLDRAVHERSRRDALLIGMVALLLVAGAIASYGWLRNSVAVEMRRLTQRIADTASGRSGEGRATGVQRYVELAELSDAADAVHAARLASQATSRQLRQVVDTAKVALIGVDTGGQIVFWNHMAQELTGLRESEVAGRRLEEVAVEEDRDRLGEQIEQALDGRSGRPFMLRLRSAGGEPVSVRMNLGSAGAVRGDGSVLVAAALDISLLVGLEAELERLLETVDALEIGLVLYDEDDRVIYRNRVAADSSEVLRDALDEPPARFEDVIMRIVRSDELAMDAEELEAWRARRFELHRSGGGVFEVPTRDGRIFRIHEQPTSFGGTVEVISDITDSERRRSR